MSNVCDYNEYIVDELIENTQISDKIKLHLLLKYLDFTQKKMDELWSICDDNKVYCVDGDIIERTSSSEKTNAWLLYSRYWSIENKIYQEIIKLMVKVPEDSLDIIFTYAFDNWFY